MINKKKCQILHIFPIVSKMRHMTEIIFYFFKVIFRYFSFFLCDWNHDTYMVSFHLFAGSIHCPAIWLQVNMIHRLRHLSQQVRRASALHIVLWFEPYLCTKLGISGDGSSGQVLTPMGGTLVEFHAPGFSFAQL